ncbi:winged helix DNA-binding domain-containing protein [Saccharopolyspora rhizosphaerae]|uniref:Winged helix DNA-binding domain-containing protein n=1 Tax=Saccharopolyspora rhizosphaerae TaxID=2492662 RepID=A0A426JUC1_9PSEU|nr:winged helix DNA-binding domain-containing protein [Saccharopolyspora rhizosphaerae]RRO16707.1 winged helix DNA-binding domain-containing protein [Saccharopolyspora rhizosphaerae]
MAVLDNRALNRATLARQLLLAPAQLDPHEAVAHLCGMQAQEPQEPFVGLWSRLSTFDPAELSHLLTRRRVVRTHLMRRTIHLLTAEDVLSWRSRHEAMLRQRVLAVYRRELADVDLDELAEAGREVLAGGEPQSQAELGKALAHRWPEPRTRALGEVLVGALIPVVQVPPRGLWRTGGAARYLPISAWLGHDVDPVTRDDAAGRGLVRRYLAAFGPAATADVRAWSGLAGLPGAVAATRDELVTFRDERGRELLDLPDAPRPDPDVPAPVRFLPAFDNALLGYDDRSRIVDDEHRGLSVAGDRVVLVDGRVAGTWRSTDGAVHISLVRSLPRRRRQDLVERGSGLASFLSEGASEQVRVS